VAPINVGLDVLLFFFLFFLGGGEEGAFCCSIVVHKFLYFLLFLFVGFELTFISVFSAVVIILWVCCCNCFFAGLQYELLDLSRFVVLLIPLGAPCQTALIVDQFSWYSCKEFIGLAASFI
jgi:hypothetical protein